MGVVTIKRFISKHKIALVFVGLLLLLGICIIGVRNNKKDYCNLKSRELKENCNDGSDYSKILGTVTCNMNKNSYSVESYTLTCIEDSEFKVRVPVLDTDNDIEKYTDRIEYSPDMCISVDISLGEVGENIQDIFNNKIEEMSTIISNDRYRDVSISDVNEAKNSVCGSVYGVYVGIGNTRYPRAVVIKVENIDRLPIVYRFGVDCSRYGEEGTKHTKQDLVNTAKVWNTLLETYGIRMHEVNEVS